VEKIDSFMERGIALLSGGIDSPVAIHLMQNRLEITAVHFHQMPLTDEKENEKVKELVKLLGIEKLYLVPFEEIQKEIIKFVPSKYRMIVYRRFMFKIAEKILENENAGAFVSGDNLAQVASQTLGNLNTIFKAASFPVLSPLIGFDKDEIIKKAREIDTFNLSILPYQDCCVLFQVLVIHYFSSITSFIIAISSRSF